MLKELKDNGLVRLEVSYSGGGDDGCIDGYSGYEINEKGEERWSQDSVPTKFQNEFDDYIYDFISDNIEWDWINNDGGYGTMMIDCTEDPWQVSINHTQRVTEDHYYDGIDFDIKDKNGSEYF